MGKKGAKGRARTAVGLKALSDIKPSPINDITASEDERSSTGMQEFDRVLGGGLIKGSLTLVGGDPGIGKSTILTQVCKNLSDNGHKVLYISGEESLNQIKLRADRLGSFTDNMKLFCETDLEVIDKVITEEKPDLVVIDSIQTMFMPSVDNAPGSVTQVRECTHFLMQVAKSTGIAVFTIGHVTKEGVVAGPRMLEHMVDTVLYFEGDTHSSFRVLRSVKNRFGSTNEIGVFEMRTDGLREVLNPSEFLLEGRPKDSAGSIVSCTIEGTRPLLIEIQALVSRSFLANPRRSSTGIDYNRMNLLLAVMEKRAGLNFSESDVYVNIVGGMRINETALDLGVVLAIASSVSEKVIAPDVMAIGEVGLSGEIRSVSMLEARVKEAEKLGFKKVIVPAGSFASVKEKTDIEIIGVKNIREALEII